MSLSIQQRLSVCESRLHDDLTEPFGVQSLYQAMLEDPIEFEGQYVRVSGKPGLGVEVSLEVMEGCLETLYFVVQKFLTRH